MLTKKPTRNEMEAQKKHIQMPSSPEVTPALIDLARLAQRVGYAVSQGASNTVTMMLLERLLTLSEVQRGLCFLLHRIPLSLDIFTYRLFQAIRSPALLLYKAWTKTRHLHY